MVFASEIGQPCGGVSDLDCLDLTDEQIVGAQLLLLGDAAVKADQRTAQGRTAGQEPLVGDPGKTPSEGCQ